MRLLHCRGFSFLPSVTLYALLRLGKSLGGRDYTYTTRGTYRTYTCATSIYETMFFSQNHRTFSSKKSTKIVGFAPILFLWHITLLIKKISPRRYLSLNFPPSSSSPLPNKKPTTSSLAPYHQGRKWKGNDPIWRSRSEFLIPRGG